MSLQKWQLLRRPPVTPAAAIAQQLGVKIYTVRAGDNASADVPFGEYLPDSISFETFEGETFSLAEQRGTPVVLNFWESW